MPLKTISLNGEWEFCYSPAKFSAGESPLPESGMFSGKMTIPGDWDDWYELFDQEDFFGLRARFNPDYRKVHFPMGRSLTPHASSCFLIGSGFYRKVINPALPPESRIVLNVGPAMWGCAVFCNRKLVGEVTSYSCAADFDLTGLLIDGQPNELIVAVCNDHDDGGAYCRVDGSHDGMAFGTRPGQHRGLAAQGFQAERGGIGGGILLKLSGKTTVSSWYNSFDGKELFWHFEFSGVPQGEIICELKENDHVIRRTVSPVNTDKLTCSFAAGDLKRWSDRSPELYTLSVTLKDPDGNILDQDERLYGLRVAETSRKQILLNGKATFFRGVTEHCYFPETCNPHFDTEKYCRDLGVLKSAGFNYIRCHTWCPPEPFYDACDRLGFLVQTELPSVYTFDEALAVIRLIRKHPSAVLFCEGNEKIICEKAIERLRKLQNILREEAPGILFMPQDAMRGVEYEFPPTQKTVKTPFEHDPVRLKAVEEFSDVHGALNNCYFSYLHDDFPGVETMEKLNSVYGLPCLSHEIGILDGYLDFSLEKRYENTYIGPDIFREARRNMQKHGVWERAEEFYQKNSLFIAAIRKQLIENHRSCPSFAGYDFLGGIDTHWHLWGYGCGFFNEFYEEKYASPISDILRYNGESILILKDGKFRNHFAGEPFEREILFSYYGAEKLEHARLFWEFGDLSGMEELPFLAPGEVHSASKIRLELPASAAPQMVQLKCRLEDGNQSWQNSWKLWLFPRAAERTADFRILDKMTDADVEYLENGGRILLTGNFPGTTQPEHFRTHCSGRSNGHSGAIVHPHKLWEQFPHEGFTDWQFYPLMDNSTSFEVTPFHPLLELIPSYKLIRKKSLLSEYQVGKGRLLMCGFDLKKADPACLWMCRILTDYLNNTTDAAPQWDPASLREQLRHAQTGNSGKKLDAGGRPIEL